MAMTFEWDSAKASANVRKHGVSFAEALTVFKDPLGRVVPDSRHSVAEERFALLGVSERGRLLAVMFTEHDDRIRLFSARRATKSERRAYEETTD